jgi:radical SAM-linked protein
MPMRVRVNYARTDTIRYTGHLDTQRVWERTLRRSRLPVAFSQGFNPQARIQIACALPLGFTSQCELLDFWLETEQPLPEIELALRRSVHPGIEILKLSETDLHQPALQTRVIAAQYQATLLDPYPLIEINLRIQKLLSESSLCRTWREKSYDLRALIESLDCSSVVNGCPVIDMRLSAKQNATGRPEEVLSALALNPLLARYERTHLFLNELPNV